MLVSLSAVLGLALVAVAHPHEARQSASIFGDWRKASNSDSRSPCPALNSLANHGILPRNGRNISLEVLTVALKEGLNVGVDFGLAIGTFGLSTARMAGNSLDLDNLGKHGAIEHDGSLSRGDFAFGNNSIFQQSIFNTVLAAAAGQDKFDLAALAAGRWARVNDSRVNNPSITYTPKEVLLSYGETGLYASVLDDPVRANPLVSYVKIFFEQERLPYQEGWTLSTLETNLASLTVLINRLQQSSPMDVQQAENTLITLNTVTSVFSGQEVEGLTPCYFPVGSSTPCQ